MSSSILAVQRTQSRAISTIAAGAGAAGLAMNFWIPFLPLYMLELGATSDANGLFWVGVATMGQGVARLVSSPLWGVLSDRMGRKVMLVRALYFATATTVIAAFATQPWHVALAFGCQGLFSGFMPAAIALASVTTSEDRLGQAVATVTGAQYVGNTVGPGIGALLAVLVGMRGAILVSALLPALAATVVLFTVARDEIQRPGVSAPQAKVRAPRSSVLRLLTGQFLLALAFYFFLFVVTQLVRLTAPISLKELTDQDPEALVGLAFTLGGLGSLLGVLFVARRWVVTGSLARTLGIGCVLAGVAHALMALAPNASLFVLLFVMVSLAEASLLPACNTLIAANVPRSRRGTAFGIAGSAQAIAFMVGPMSAAAFAAVSLALGYLLLGVLFMATGLLLRFVLREPRNLEEENLSPAVVPPFPNLEKGRLAIRP